MRATMVPMGTTKAETLTGQRKREWLLFSLLASALYAFLLGMVFLFFLREGGRRRMELEYRAWRVSSLLLESLYAGSAPSELGEGILALGVYDGAGRAVQVAGRAPASVAIAEDLGERISVSEGIVKVTRRIAWGGPARMRRLLMPFDAPGDGDQALPRPAWPYDPSQPRQETQGRGMMGQGMMSQGRILYLELGSRNFMRREALFLAMGTALVLGLAAAWIISLRLYRRVLSYAEAAQRDRELIQLGEAARTIAHEIKNPLGTIRLQCATLGKILPEERKRNLQVIEAQTQRLTALADRIGDFLRNPRGREERIDLEPWLASWAIKRSLAYSLKSPVGATMVDPSRLESVLDNLLANAREALDGLQASQGEGHGVAEGDQGGILLEYGSAGPRAFIELADRGPGLDPAIVAQVWKPFFTTKARGMGIGLALAKRFVEEAGGSLSYRPREGGGAVFRIELPLLP